MNNPPVSKWILVIALPVILAIFYFTASLHFGYTPDDTYIYLRFAKNLIHGNGISFNPGTPSYGFTSPLWLFIVSLGGAIGVDLYTAAKAIDLLLASLALIVFYLLSYELMRDVAVAICATVAFSVNAWLLRWAGSGMETSLTVLLLLATFLFCFRNEYFIAIVTAALLTLARPEAALVLPIILFDLYMNSVSKQRALNFSAALVLIYVVLLAPWFIYAYVTFGTILPNTATAKAGLHPGITQLLATCTDIVKTLGAADGLALIALAVSGVLLYHRRERLPQPEENGARFFLARQATIVLSWIAALPLFYLVTDVNVVSRYLLLVTPMITVLAFSFLHQLVSIGKKVQGIEVALPTHAEQSVGVGKTGASPYRFAYGAVLLLTALIMAQNQVLYRMVVYPGIQAFEQGMENCLIPIGKWLHEHADQNAEIVTADVGAIGYYSDRHIFDAAGLISPNILPLLHQGRLPYDIIEQRLYEPFCTPDFVIDRAPQPELLKSDPTFLALFTRPFFMMSLGNEQIIYYTVYKVQRRVGV